MKTLKTLLAVTLLVSSVAPVVAMEAETEPTVVAEPTKFARAAQWLKDGFTMEYLKGEDEVRHFDMATLRENKVNLAKTAGLYAAVAAVVAGAGYAVYSFINSDEADEEVVEPTANTTSEVVAPVAPVKPVVKPAAKPNFRAPRRGRFAKRTRSARKSSCKSSKSSCKSSKSSCKPCQA